MELVRLECDFPVIGGQQGSLLGLSRVHGKQDGAAGLSLPPEGREGPQLLQLGGTGLFSGCPAHGALEQLGNGILWIGDTWA